MSDETVQATRAGMQLVVDAGALAGETEQLPRSDRRGRSLSEALEAGATLPPIAIVPWPGYFFAFLACRFSFNVF